MIIKIDDSRRSLAKDGSWFFPLSELTINELKNIKTIIKGNI